MPLSLFIDLVEFSYPLCAKDVAIVTVSILLIYHLRFKKQQEQASLLLLDQKPTGTGPGGLADAGLL